MGVHPDTEYARAYHCPVIAAMDDPDIVETAHLPEQAAKEALQAPCLWMRGLVPSSLLPQEAPPEVRYLKLHGCCEQLKGQ